jgi:hypothetical protein
MGHACAAYRIRLRDLVQPASATTDKGGERHVKVKQRCRFDAAGG